MLEFVCRFDVEFELEIAVGDEFELELEMIKFDVEFEFFGCVIDVEVGIEFAFELELEFEVGTIAGAGGITVESMKARVLAFKLVSVVLAERDMSSLTSLVFRAVSSSTRGSTEA